MQIKKDDVITKIVSSANSEFMAMTYASASMNTIAKEAGISRGAIYTYFDSKQVLFKHVCQEAVSILEHYLKFDFDKYSQRHKSYTQEELVQSFYNFARYVQIERVPFMLLFFKAAGSDYENFREVVIKDYAKAFPVWAVSKSSDNKVIKGVAGEMFVHTIAGMFVSYIEEILLHNPSDDELRCYSDHLAMFIFSGLQALNIYTEENKNEKTKETVSF